VNLKRDEEFEGNKDKQGIRVSDVASQQHSGII